MKFISAFFVTFFLSALALGSFSIPNGAVSTAKIADSAVTTAKINDAAVTTAKIGSGAITTALLPITAVLTPAPSGTNMNIVFAIASSNCTGTPCSLAGFSGVSATGVARTGQGAYTMTFSSAYTTAGPCWAMCSDGSSLMAQPPFTYPSTSAFAFQCRNVANANVDAGFMAMCFGAK